MENQARKERILVVQPYGIGDTLFIFPLLKALKLQRDAERLDVIIGPRTRQLMQLCPYVDEIHVIDKDLWKRISKIAVLREKIKLLFHCASRHYDLAFDFSMQPEYSFWAKFFLRIPIIAGFNYKKRNIFLNKPLNLPEQGYSGKSVIEYVCDLAGLIGLDIADKKPELRLSSNVEAAAEKLLKDGGWSGGRYIVVSAGGGATWGMDAYYKQWPPEYFVQFLKLLGVFFDPGAIVLLGTDDERRFEKLFSGLSAPIIPLFGETDIAEAAAIIKHAALFIGNDGGLAHIASCQDIPMAVFYGPADPKVYGPYPSRENAVVLSRRLPCQPCYQYFRYNKSCQDIACLRGLLPEDALAQLNERRFFEFFKK
ncbi:ADP-heptose--lipooligosaccharide heptosyltransferase II [Candidatus Velamenicoccus archaeovorus]|uniref:ADP-heptose--lipooligosaccharide heptosyltransferase II n=1 Tax=Velamenicoccus archaeovorus TaxID=1930593 RepID=A0A410P468_VELA1|nr:glycosyltransferase family 9 protein [Candidatus Velamenicoccus archaeovorus]QAT17005.1 ADP-heptose--lipooligosaccharide heptosyltransferase II [Candidatus Velamenicoccus archaeovorus]